MPLTRKNALDWAHETIETFVSGAGCRNPQQAADALTVLIVMAGFAIEGATSKRVAVEALRRAAEIIEKRTGSSEVQWHDKN